MGFIIVMWFIIALLAIAKGSYHVAFVAIWSAFMWTLLAARSPRRF